ncbi:MAG: sigma-54-dependent transcriptional regulator [Nitrospiria bacterium]
MKKILIVDNEKSMRDFLAIVLKKEGYQCQTAEDGQHALAIFEKTSFDLVLTDIKMPKMSGLELLKALKTVSPETATVMMTAFASTETAVEAMKEGAYDYITKPFQVDEVKLIIKNVLERKTLQQENRLLRSELKLQADFNQIIGKSDKIQNVFRLVEKVADNRSNVLITGESGTGKELIARAIHYNSGRKDHSFVTVNCSALPEALLESELFGHMKGAFTGAIGNKPGLFELADQGSIFLDEIGETSLAIQVKLLRVIQEREFRRIGGIQDIHVDVRIIAATNKDLEKLVDEGTFREDLYYRLDVIPIRLPPLRERPEDIPLLVNFFLKRYNERLGKAVQEVTPEVMRLLVNYEWKGNVRELQNVIERAIALTSNKCLTPEDFTGSLSKPPQTIPIPVSIPKEGLDLDYLIGKIEKQLLVKALQDTNWVKKEAARRLNIDFRSFRYRLAKYGIKRFQEASPSPELIGFKGY